MDVKILSILVLIFLLFAETDSAAKSSKDKAASRIGRGSPYSFAGPLKTSRSARRQKARKLNRTVGEKHAQGTFFSGDYGHANIFSKPIPEYFQFNANRDVKIHGNGQIIMEDVTENGQEKKSKPDGHTDLQTGTAETQMEIPESKGGPQILSNAIAYANGQ